MHATSVRIATSHHAPFDRMGLHEHESAYLSFVIAGEYVERVGSTRIDCVANRVRFHPLGEVHADNFGAGGGRCLNLELDPSWGPFVAELGLDDPCDAVLADTAAWDAMRAWSAWRRQGGLSALAVEEATASLLGACAKACFDAKSFVGHPGIRRAIEYLHHAREPFCLGDVAAAAELHPTHLARLFRQRLGCTVGDYARKVRLVQALDSMVTNPGWTLSRVSVEAGFADHPHFARQFKRTIGAPPSEFRATRRQMMSETDRVAPTLTF